MRCLGILVALWCVATGAATAQESGIRVYVTPKIGVFASVSTLADFGDGDFDDREFDRCEFENCEVNDCEFEDRDFDDRDDRHCEFDLDSSPAIGLAVEVKSAGSRFGVRLNLDYATGTELLSHGESLSEDDNTILAVTADVLYRITGDPQVRPYVLGGIGLKHYEFEVPAFSEFDGSANDFTLHAGAGVEINVGFGAIMAEASDYISWFKPEDAGSSKMQNDIFGMVGIRIGLF